MTGYVRVKRAVFTSVTVTSVLQPSHPSVPMSGDSDYAEARNSAQRGWVRKLESALKSDGWGQVIEAVEAYDECDSSHSVLL